MQVEPGLNPLAFSACKLKYDEPLSHISFNIQSRPYSKEFNIDAIDKLNDEMADLMDYSNEIQAGLISS